MCLPTNDNSIILPSTIHTRSFGKLAQVQHLDNRCRWVQVNGQTVFVILYVKKRDET